MATAKITTPAAALDLAADSPVSYAELRELNAARALPTRLAAMSPRERVGAAALVAAMTGKDVSQVQARLARLAEEGGAEQPQPTPPAPAAPALPRRPRAIVASDSDPKLAYIVSTAACTCPGWRFRKACKHVRRAREEWAARVRTVLARRPALAA